MENYDLLVIGDGPAGITLAKNMGKTVKMGVIDTVRNVDFDNKVVSTQNNGGYYYDKLVIATGADPIVLQVLSNFMDYEMVEEAEEIVGKL